MPLSDVRGMVEAARIGGYAIGYFEAWNLESLQGVIDAPEETRSPIIIAFSGDFLSRPERLTAERLSIYAAMGRAAAEEAGVPCGLIFNECPRDDWVQQAILAGFNLVMPVATAEAYEDYASRVAKLVAMAHEHGAAVEAELGDLPCGSAGTIVAGGSSTDPQRAARFVRETNVDLLAVSVGNVHIMIQGEKPLDLNRLKAIRREVPTPLVLHGGTGIARDSLEKAIACGVVKVNYGTYLKQRYLAAIRRKLGEERPNPHELLGLGGEWDLLVAGRNAVREAVLERMDWLGCCGRT
ncbi:MAG: class II fructose-bisphosphate aldolase [Pirellulaceae bacterium]